MATFNAKFIGEDTLNANFTEADNMTATFGQTQIIETGDYNPLSNKPQINDVTLQGNKTFEDLGDHVMTNAEIKAIFDRIFKGGN